MKMTLDMYIDKLMKVKGEHGGNLEVVKVSDNFELGNSIVALNEHYTPRVELMERYTRSFRDAFDGTRYQTEVYRPRNEENEITTMVLNL